MQLWIKYNIYKVILVVTIILRQCNNHTISLRFIISLKFRQNFFCRVAPDVSMMTEASFGFADVAIASNIVRLRRINVNTVFMCTDFTFMTLYTVFFEGFPVNYTLCSLVPCQTECSAIFIFFFVAVAALQKDNSCQWHQAIIQILYMII